MSSRLDCRRIGALQMTDALSILAVVLVAVTMGLALAHALEYPGKLRLDEATYRQVQAVYYPGFTVGGLVGEAGALLVLPVLLVMLPYGSERFWWAAAAFACLLTCHAVYWTITHPVNGFWLKDTDVGSAGSAFFLLLAGQETNWQRMRDVWEYSHIARAVLAMAALVSLSTAGIAKDG